MKVSKKLADATEWVAYKGEHWELVLNMMPLCPEYVKKNPWLDRGHHILFTAETNFFTLSGVGVTIPRLKRNSLPMQVISCLGTSSDLSLFTLNHSEDKRWRNLSQSWHKRCLTWFTTNQVV